RRGGPLGGGPRRRHDHLRRRDRAPTRGRGRRRAASEGDRGGGRRRARRAARAARRRGRRRRARDDRRGPRRVLPRERRARPLEAAARLPLRRPAAEEPLRQDPAPPAPNREKRPITNDRCGRGIAEGIATVTLDVPGKFNRISMDAREQFARVFDELGGDDAVRAIVLGGAGETFTAGGDIGMFLERTPAELSRLAWNVAAPERCP